MPTTYATNEFDRLLKQREALWASSLRSMSNAVVMRAQLGDTLPEPEATAQAWDFGSLLANADPGEQQIQQTLREMRDADDLIGAARLYGIPSPERVPTAELQDMVAQERETVRGLMGEGLSLKQALFELGRDTTAMQAMETQTPGFGTERGVGLLMTGIAQQSLRILGNIAERLPFMQDAVSRGEKMREADRWFSQLQEGLTAGLPEERRKLNRGVASAVGMMPAGYLSWELLGAIGAVPKAASLGAKLTPLGRSTLRGLAAEMVIQDPTAPVAEQAINAGFGAAFGFAEALGGPLGRTIMGTGLGALLGSVASDGDPRTTLMSAAGGAVAFNAGAVILNRLGRSFPSGLDLDWEPVGANRTYDAEVLWESPEGLLGGGPRQLPPGGGPQLPPGAAPTGAPPAGLLGPGPTQLPAGEVLPGLPPGTYEMAPQGPAGLLGPGAPPPVRLSFADPRPTGQTHMGFEATAPSGEGVFIEGYYHPKDQSFEIDTILSNVVGKTDVWDHLQAGHAWTRETGSAIVGQLEEMGLPVQRIWGERVTGTRGALPVGDPRRQMSIGASRLKPREAGTAAAQLTKQSTVMESPVLADVMTAPVLDDADAAWAVVESFPGQIGVVQNVGDVASTVERILTQQMPAGLGPQDFRVVRRRLGIQSAAVRAEGQIFTGRWHGEASEAAEAAGLVPEELDEFGDIGGFITTTGQFLNRSEASELALRNRQWDIERQLNDPFLATGIDEVASGESPPGGMDAQYVLEPPFQTDILVSSGKPITDRMVKQYEEFGMFAGQRAKLPSGQEVVIEKLGPKQATVTPLHGGKATRVATADLLPMKSSHVIEDLPGAYEDFQSFAAVRLDADARAAGLAQPLDIMSEEVAPLVPGLMEEYIGTLGLDPKKAYGAALRTLLEQRHIEALRLMAPPEELAMQQAVQAQLTALQETIEPEPSSVLSLLEARGFDAERLADGSLRITDRVSNGDLQVELENDAAAREFAHSFQREAIDDSPVTPFPLEVVETPVGYSETSGKMPGDFSGNADRHADALEEAMANWYSMGGEELLNEMLGGGGWMGGEPPRVPPPPSGTFPGGGEPPRALPPIDDPYARHGEQWQRVRKTDPRRLKIMLGRYNNLVTRLFVPMRNAIERMQQGARSLGVGEADYLTAVRELDAQYNRHINAAHPWEERAYDILNPVRNRFWRDGTFWEVLNAPRHQQPHLMRNAGFNPAEREAVVQFQSLMEDFFQNEARVAYPDMGHVENYVTWFRRFEEDLPGDPWRKPTKAEWGPENVRGEDLENIEKNMGAIIPRYFRSFYKSQYMQPTYQHIKRMMAPEAVPEVIREAVVGFADAKMWGLDPTKDWMVQGAEWMLNAVGRPLGQTFSRADVMKLFYTKYNLEYRAALGGRIDPLIRDLPQGLIGVTHVGLDKGIPVLKRLLRDEAYGVRARQLAHEAGWVQEGGGASIDPDVFGSSAPESTPLREGLARVADVAQDRLLRPLAMRHGIQGTWLDWLAPYGRLGDFARTWNAMTAYEAATDALRNYAAKQAAAQSWAVPQEELQQELLRESRVGRFQGGVQQTFLDYVNAGDYEKAARFFAGEAAASQNLYGMAQQPSGWQRLGPITGKQAMQWMTFNSQTLANMAHIFSDKAIRPRDKMAYAAQVGTLQALMAGAQLATGWNWMRASLLGVGFGFAGQGLFDMVNNLQRLSATIQEFDPTGRPLNPDQRALQGSPGSSYGNPLDPRYSSLNPWAGGLRTIEGLTQAEQWGPEATARFLITGERGDPFTDRMQRGQIEWQTEPQSFLGPLQGGATPQSTPDGIALTPTAPPPVVTFGVLDESRVYAHPRSGAPVVDTPNRTQDGRVPTHRVDVPSGRAPNETWEAYEARVLAEPEEAFGPEVRQTIRDPALLEPETQGKLQALLMTAAAEGVQLHIAETLRTQRRQEWLFRQGRATPGAPVTWTLTTNHSDGRAADLVASSPEGYAWIQANAGRFGLQVLGDYDAGHVFNAAPAKLAEMHQAMPGGSGGYGAF